MYATARWVYRLGCISRLHKHRRLQLPSLLNWPMASLICIPSYLAWST